MLFTSLGLFGAVFGVPTGSLPTQNAFEFNVTCDPVASSYCNKAKFDLEFVGNLFASQILIQKPITVDVAILNGNPQEPPSKSTTTTVASKMNGGPLLLYPQAAVKQQVNSIKFPTADIKLDFRSISSFFLGNSATDFKLFAAKELLRGLGVSSALTYYPNGTIGCLLSPAVSNVGEKSYFSPLSAFDSLLHLTKYSLGNVLNPIITFPAANLDTADYLNRAKAFPLLKDIFVTVFRMLSSPLLVAKLPQAQINVQGIFTGAGNVFKYYARPSADISNGADGPEFLLYRETGSKNSIQAHLRRKLFLGPVTLQILEQIGYSSTIDQKSLSFQVSKTFNTASYSPSDAEFDDSPLNGANLVNTFLEDENLDVEVDPKVFQSELFSDEPPTGKSSIQGSQKATTKRKNEVLPDGHPTLSAPPRTTNKSNPPPYKRTKPN